MKLKQQKMQKQQNKKGRCKGMEGILTKILIVAIAGGLTVASVVGVNTVKKAAAQNQAQETLLEAQDTLQGNEMQFDEPNKELYENEAIFYYDKYKDQIDCTEEEFIDEFIKQRENGASNTGATSAVLNNYKKASKAAKVVQAQPVSTPQEVKTVDLIQVKETPAPEEKAEYIRTNLNFEIIDSDPRKMYATQQVNIRDIPSTDGNILGKLTLNQEVTVTGYVKQYNGEECLWYRLDDPDQDKFVNGGYLVLKPVNASENTTETKTASTIVTADTTKDKKNQVKVQAQPQKSDKDVVQLQQQQQQAALEAQQKAQAEAARKAQEETAQVQQQVYEQEGAIYYSDEIYDDGGDYAENVRDVDSSDSKYDGIEGLELN